MKRGTILLALGFALLTMRSEAGAHSPKIHERPVSLVKAKTDNYHLEVELGRLTPVRFDEFKAVFRAGPDRHEPDRAYVLSDFFPDFARGLMGRRLVADPVEIPETLRRSLVAIGVPAPERQGIYANCHSFTWQWINHIQSRGSGDPVFLTAPGAELFFEVKKSFVPVEQKNLRPNDVIFVRGVVKGARANAILHSAVVVGDGLVAEKTDSPSIYPFRVARLQDVISKYRKASVSFEILGYRPGVGTEPLPRPEDVVSVAQMSRQKIGQKIGQNVGQNADVQKAFGHLPVEIGRRHFVVEVLDSPSGKRVQTIAPIRRQSELAPGQLVSAL
jgi:hypothetical protein